MTHPQLEAALAKADAFIAKYPTVCQYEKLKEIETKTGYSKVYFFLLVVLSLSGLTYAVGGLKLVSDLISFVYPAYASFKAIDSGMPGDDTQWLTYWILFGGMSIIENTLTFVTEWIPFYFPIKLAFFVWLYHPHFLGAGLVYTKFLRPVLAPYIDSLKKNPQSPAVSMSNLVGEQADKKDM